MRIMIIGASRNPDKFGHKALLAYLRQGHTVLPVNPAAHQIAGVSCYADVTQPPGPIDRATLYLHPEDGVNVLDALAGRGDVGELYINPGAESDELLARARELNFDPIQACSIVAIGERP